MDRNARARLRAEWPGGKVQVHASAQLETAEARLATMWALALDAWSLRGEALPTYTRQDIPGRVIRRP